MAGRHNRVMQKRKKPAVTQANGEPIPDTHCPHCGQPRDVKGFPQGYKHGKKVLCDECQETWVRNGCRDEQEQLLPAQRHKGKHKSLWD